MISAPRITPPARATSCADAGDQPGEDAAGDRRRRVLDCRPRRRRVRPGRCRARRSALRRSSAASTEAPISSVWSTTPRTVATTTPIIRASRPRTTRPAARVGLNLWRWRTPTSGLNITASTAANVSGSTISLTAASAMTTMIAASTNPTKLQAQTPSLGTRPADPERHSARRLRRVEHFCRSRRLDQWSGTCAVASWGSA